MYVVEMCNKRSSQNYTIWSILFEMVRGVAQSTQFIGCFVFSLWLSDSEIDMASEWISDSI